MYLPTARKPIKRLKGGVLVGKDPAKPVLEETMSDSECPSGERRYLAGVQGYVYMCKRRFRYKSVAFSGTLF